MAVIRTVLGDIPPENLGYTDMHEHTFLNMRQFKWKFPRSIPNMIKGGGRYEEGKDLAEEAERRKTLKGYIAPPPPTFDGVFNAFGTKKGTPAHDLPDIDFYTNELLAFKQVGGEAMCDCSPCMKPKSSWVQELSRASGVKLVITTGYYTEAFIPRKDLRKGTDFMKAKLLDEVRNGDGSSDAKPGFLKCAISVLKKDGTLSEAEKMAVTACALAAKESGLPLHIHTQFPLRRAHIREIADLLEKQLLVDPDRVLFCHMDGFNTSAAAKITPGGYELEFPMELMERGFHLGLDTWGTKKQFEDAGTDDGIRQRTGMLRDLLDAGYGDKLTLGHDCMNKNGGVQMGGYGYTFFPRWLSKLETDGVLTSEEVKQLVIINPAKILSI